MSHTTHPLTKLEKLVESINPQNITVPKSVLEDKKLIIPIPEENHTQNLNQILLETCIKQNYDINEIYKAIEENKNNTDKTPEEILQMILLKQILINL